MKGGEKNGRTEEDAADADEAGHFAVGSVRGKGGGRIDYPSSDEESTCG